MGTGSVFRENGRTVVARKPVSGLYIVTEKKGGRAQEKEGNDSTGDVNAFAH